ncbi:hypothetical protein PVAND_006249 [Polypedilum vanderplanki]|uniref:Uncharacterized protein n=1 Tax=Polypedilum vanderplanki TaxID=319348 RepID=A0A9J6C3M2_POLVA|nr:hypothetical protein PVAND_006249 [Polypedilum vanderplanki]
MWKIIIQIILICTPLCNAAEVYCQFDGVRCTFDRVVNVTKENEDITIIGQLSTYTDSQVGILNMLPTSQVTYFPTKILKVFPNVTKIQLIGNNLQILVPNAFDYCDNLDEIMAMGENFNYLPSGFAQNCVKLAMVAFNNGQISSLDPNALKGLVSLKRLSFQTNKIKCIPAEFFSYTPLLETVQMNENLISAIDSLTFKNLPNLYYVDFTNNKISYLSNLDWTGTGTNQSNPNRFMTTHFTFNLNPLVAIHPQYLSTLFEVTRVMYQTQFTFPVSDSNLTTCFTTDTKEINSYNWDTLKVSLQPCFNNWSTSMASSIPCISPFGSTSSPPTQSTSSSSTQSTSSSSTLSSTKAPSFNSCASNRICRYYLDYMDRYTCVIDNVDGVLTSISGTHISSLLTDANVTRVYFKNSFLSRIPSVLFSKFPNLEFLSVANCSLGMITNATIPSCGNLAYLDARYNDIFHVSSGAFRNCKNLQIIDFTGNPIDVLDTNIFIVDPSLKKVILNGNGK